jgi:hypothetical protein
MKSQKRKNELQPPKDIYNECANIIHSVLYPCLTSKYPQDRDFKCGFCDCTWKQDKRTLSFTSPIGEMQATYHYPFSEKTRPILKFRKVELLPHAFYGVAVSAMVCLVQNMRNVTELWTEDEFLPLCDIYIAYAMHFRKKKEWNQFFFFEQVIKDAIDGPTRDANILYFQDNVLSRIDKYFNYKDHERMSIDFVRALQTIGLRNEFLERVLVCATVCIENYAKARRR